MTRFWITLSQAVQLVLWALEDMQGGEAEADVEAQAGGDLLDRRPVRNLHGLLPGPSGLEGSEELDRDAHAT